MKSSLAVKLAIAFGVILSAVSVSAKNTYPRELEFLSQTKTPRYISVSGMIDPIDSSGKTLLSMPFHFYWEKGNFTFDVRMPGGGPAGFFRGIADTVWIYDFMRQVKLVSFINKPSGMSTGIPFTPKDVLLLFNLFPGGFDNIDTFYNEGSSLFVTTAEGTIYEFDSATKRPKSIKSASSQIVFSDFIETKDVVWPSRVELTAGVIIPGAVRMIVNTKDIDFERETDRELLEHVPDFRLAREFDLRQQILQNR